MCSFPEGVGACAAHGGRRGGEVGGCIFVILGRLICKIAKNTGRPGRRFSPAGCVAGVVYIYVTEIVWRELWRGVVAGVVAGPESSLFCVF